MVDLLAVKNDGLDNCDKLLYSLLPICIICFNSSRLPIPFMHINSLQHTVAQHFVQIQHPLDYMVLLLFSWDPQGAYKEQGFLFIINYRACSLYNYLCELHPCTHYMGNYTKRTLSIWGISFQVYLCLNCRHISLMFLVLKIGFLLIFCTNLILVLRVLFFHVVLFLIRSWNFVDFGTFLLKRLRTYLCSILIFWERRFNILTGTLLGSRSRVLNHGIHTQHEYDYNIQTLHDEIWIVVLLLAL